jgi:hypothetical protein
MKRYLPFLLLVLALSSCFRKKFDAPPDNTGYDPNLPVNTTINQLKEMYTGTPKEITQDLIIYGIVNADDRSGNLYKQIIIQDSTSGIAVLLGRASLYTDFPVGRKVYIRCKGLYLGEYNGFVQLGAKPSNSGDLSDIPTSSFAQHIVKASYPHTIQPRVVSLISLQSLNANNKKWLGTLLQIDSVQFKGQVAGGEYAELPNISSGTDLDVEDCAGLSTILRVSGYSNFRGALTPTGKGRLQAVMSIYGSTIQLLIRDTNDVQFKGPRCGWGSSNDTLITITQLRNLFTTGGKQTVANRLITGTVISDMVGNNLSSNRNLFLQQGDRGIVLRFATGADNYLKMGDSILVQLKGDTLLEFSGLMQVGDQIKSSQVLKVGIGTVIPRVATMADIITNFEQWESTLVTINNATLGGGTGAYYNGSSYISMSDNTVQGGLDHYTSSFATFKNSLVPTGASSLTGILWQNATGTQKHFSIRNLNDVK